MQLSDEQKQDYCNHPGLCPYCGEFVTLGEFVDVFGIKAKQEISCASCKKRWYDVYVLGDIEEID